MYVHAAKSLTAALALAVAACFASGDFEIEWDKPVDLGAGGYARIHRLADGRLMAAYAKGGEIVARFYARGTRECSGTWGECVTVARGFVATNGTETGWVSLANAEFAQLETGRLIYACNLRPKNGLAHPYAIAVTTSDDAGKTWSPLKTIYRAEVPGHPEAPSRGCGCWEPFVLPLKGNAAQIYFADESPYYRPGKGDWQNVSQFETADGGETWGGPKVAAYTPKRRDGMPVVMELGQWRYLAIEANPPKTRLHPQIVMCPRDGGWENAVRFEPLAEPPDWRKTYGGAPYIAATENYILLSWQESSLPGDPVATSIARVAAVPKKEIKPDGTFLTMRGVSTPQGVEIGKDRMLWNSLCPLDGDSFLLVAECRGRIKVFQGEIKQIERDEQ